MGKSKKLQNRGHVGGSQMPKFKPVNTPKFKPVNTQKFKPVNTLKHQNVKFNPDGTPMGKIIAPSMNKAGPERFTLNGKKHEYYKTNNGYGRKLVNTRKTTLDEIAKKIAHVTPVAPVVPVASVLASQIQSIKAKPVVPAAPVTSAPVAPSTPTVSGERRRTLTRSSSIAAPVSAPPVAKDTGYMSVEDMSRAAKNTQRQYMNVGEIARTKGTQPNSGYITAAESVRKYPLPEYAKIRNSEEVYVKPTNTVGSTELKGQETIKSIPPVTPITVKEYVQPKVVYGEFTKEGLKGTKNSGRAQLLENNKKLPPEERIYTNKDGKVNETKVKEHLDYAEKIRLQTLGLGANGKPLVSKTARISGITPFDPTKNAIAEQTVDLIKKTVKTPEEQTELNKIYQESSVKQSEYNEKEFNNATQNVDKIEKLISAEVDKFRLETNKKKKKQIQENLDKLKNNLELKRTLLGYATDRKENFDKLTPEQKIIHINTKQHGAEIIRDLSINNRFARIEKNIDAILKIKKEDISSEEKEIKIKELFAGQFDDKLINYIPKILVTFEPYNINKMLYLSEQDYKKSLVKNQTPHVKVNEVAPIKTPVSTERISSVLEAPTKVQKVPTSVLEKVPEKTPEQIALSESNWKTMMVPKNMVNDTYLDKNKPLHEKLQLIIDQTKMPKTMDQRIEEANKLNMNPDQYMYTLALRSTKRSQIFDILKKQYPELENIDVKSTTIDELQKIVETLKTGPVNLAQAIAQAQTKSPTVVKTASETGWVPTGNPGEFRILQQTLQKVEAVPTPVTPVTQVQPAPAPPSIPTKSKMTPKQIEKQMKQIESFKKIYKKQLLARNNAYGENTTPNHNSKAQNAANRWIKEGLTIKQALKRVKANIEYFTHH